MFAPCPNLSTICAIVVIYLFFKILCANSFVTRSVRYVVSSVLYATCLVLCNKPRYCIGFAKKLLYRYAIYSFERHEKKEFEITERRYRLGL